MKKQHTVRVRMGAPYWDISVRTPGETHSGWTTVDLRKADKVQQREAIFEVVKFVRVRRDEALAA